jgi:hypothetical protein
MFARSHDIVAVAIRGSKKVGGAYYSAHPSIKSARGRLIFAGGRFYPFHPAVTVSEQDPRSSQPWLKRLSVHSMEKGKPFPFAISRSRFVDHRTGPELKQYNRATCIVRIG